ncbi:hypothetical protein ABL78_5146 [Leptomonas seymouri]|uniref:Uncharacterized protein n=1 Tax=Leptomonas seymouri TaxID=5684 RepID=A0A0N0P4X1_LEPSE|nr:hypothetical protein ABL78_5146 [Leptomonas seymouri]|eukprot:KPI85789.1 hypothetical protein ABL78_5146 [Leptomonas seymouri]
MSHYGDPEAHRCVLEEVAARPTAPILIAYLRAAVMGSQGSDVGLQQLRRFPDPAEQAGPHLKITFALLSMTVLASAAKPSFRREQQRVHKMLARERESLMQRGEQLKSNCGNGSGDPLALGVPSTAAVSPTVGFPSADISSALATVAATAAAIGGLSPALPSSGVGEAGAAEDELTSPMQRWALSMDILNYCEAYANYLNGFTVLWYELFGPHYYYQRVSQLDPRDWETGDQSLDADSGEWASAVPLLSHTLRGPQVPPHLYAVRWGDILTPQRRAWFQGLHNVVKELLVRILSRELPLELYALFILYANLSLRVYLLQTLAEVFGWTSYYLDVLCYVHVMRRSYSIQCEMSELQRIWAAFGLFDNRFIENCREFNKMYTESQGAFSEQEMMVRNTRGAPHTYGVPVGRPPMLSDGAIPLFSGEAQSSPHSPSGNAKATAHGLSPALSSMGVLSTAAVSTPTSASPNGDGAGAMLRVFPRRAVMGNVSLYVADAVDSSASSSQDDEPLSSASEAAPETGARKTKRAVYLPLFYTCCCFTWILQRSFWSMYGRCSLLLESCLGSEMPPQVLRVGVGSVGEGGGSSALFAATSLGARRRGAAAAGLNGAGALSPATLTSQRATSTAGSTRSPHTPAAATSVSDRERRGAIEASCAASSPHRTSSLTHSSQPRVHAGQGGAATSHLVGRPPQVTPTLQSRPLSPPQQQLRAQLATSTPLHNNATNRVLSNPPSSAETAAAAPSSGSPWLSSEAASSIAAAGGRSGGGEQSGFSSRWGPLLNKLVPQRFQHRGSPCLKESPAMRLQPNEGSCVAVATASSSLGRIASQRTIKEDLAAATVDVENGGDSAAAAVAATVPLTCSGEPFFLQYPHREHEMQLYDNPSASFAGGENDAECAALFFEEFHFLRETGCYMLSHALRSLTCYPRYPTTLLILTDNTLRPGRVSWCDHKFSVLSSSVVDGDERQGLTPWVLCAVIPHTRLSSDRAVRARQEERLLQHVVFQVAGAKSPRVRFCTANSVFYALNGGADMDGGRLYYALHLHVPHTISEGGSVSTQQVMQEESKWAFRGLGELHCSWAMPCTCNEAVRVAFQVGPVDNQAVEL